MNEIPTTEEFERQRIHEYNKEAYAEMLRLAYFYCLQGRGALTWKPVKPLEKQKENKKETNEQQ